jgi:diguanylate cyclase (GGDEF)-like protein
MMRISTITNWAYGITVALTALSAAAFILSADAGTRERRAVEQHLALDDLGEELAIGSEERSDAARLYVMQGSQSQLDAFTIDEGEVLRRDKAILDIRAFGPSDAEQAALTAAEQSAVALDLLEEKAVGLYGGGDKIDAQNILFGPDHERLLTALSSDVERLRELTSSRTTATLNDARHLNDFFSACAKFILALTGLVFLGVLYFVLRKRVALPLMKMTGVVKRLASQDYAVELPVDGRRDEIGEMNEAIQVFRTNGLERDRLDAERRRDQQTKDLILQLMHRLQACQTQTELAETVARFAPQIFPDVPGHLYIMTPARTSLSLSGTWLNPRQNIGSFQSDRCWGLRRGRPHVSNDHAVDIPCQHLAADPVVSLCVPLTAQGDAVGLLYFEESQGADLITDHARLYVELMAENIGLAIANLQLRERLTNLAHRDALTGLFNRRSLDDEMNRIAATPPEGEIGCLMIDIDHFKRFNDEFGHEVGDIVMQIVAQIMVDLVGDKGKVYRFGGEEFTVLLQGCSKDEVFAFGEAIREGIERTPLAYRGRILGSITVSIGASLSTQKGSIADLLRQADATLLIAKSSGRNTVVTADSYPVTTKRRQS